MTFIIKDLTQVLKRSNRAKRPTGLMQMRLEINIMLNNFKDD